MSLLDGETRFFFFFFFEKSFLKNGFWSRHLFLFYFKRENKIRNKNPKCDSLFRKIRVHEKPSPNLEIMLPIGKVQ